MAITTRQSNLLVQQDWTKVYQTFRDADFQSYDYETLRKTMIDYLRSYYPEDFNDFTESSEYIALIDLIAFLGQSLAFRTDLNARENFIDTAERRDSVLKLARLISYNPKRNIAASGFLKITSLSTTESITDSNGMNLANLLITWNDAANENWLEQFTAILNATLVDSQVVGKPGASSTVSGVKTDEYSVSTLTNTAPVYKFNAQVESSSMPFEIVSATAAGQSYIYEVAPTPSGIFNLLYKNDNQGNGSNNTGFFVYFKQGDLNSMDFTISEKLPNRVVNIAQADINNTDVWLYSLTPQGTLDTLWTKVPAVSGVNVIYNSSTDRNVYQVNTRVNDQIDLVFGDGAFANVPQGNFRLFYRQSNGLNYKITPDEMPAIVTTISYVSRTGSVETLSVTASLNYTVANSSARESSDDIRTKAPQLYYTQNRMITGEDYNILPYTKFSNVVKAKTVNRTSSGISRYLDVADVSGKYSSTNIFAQDGSVYRSFETTSSTFTFSTTSEVYSTIYSTIVPVLSSKEFMHLYHYTEPTIKNLNSPRWVKTLAVTGGSTGFFADGAGNLAQIGTAGSGGFEYLETGALVKFEAPVGSYFNKDNVITTGTPASAQDRIYIYAAIAQSTTTGATLSANVPSGAYITEITPRYSNTWTADFVANVANLMLAKKDFSVNYANRTWAISATVNTADMLQFKFAAGQYTVVQRKLCYYIESALETRFYFDPKARVYDSATGTVITDHVKILKANSQPNSNEALADDQTWYIYNSIVQADGYQNTQRVLITFPDSNSDGIPDDPTLFDQLVAPTDTGPLVFFRQVLDYDNFVKTELVEAGTVNTSYATYNEILLNSAAYAEGQVFYATIDGAFYQIVNGTVTATSKYAARTGRQDLYFQYRHNSPNNRRIDPSPNNIMDLYVLTKEYNTAYSAWIKDTSNKVARPSEPTTEALRIEFAELETLKAQSDTVVYNSAKFKPVFGAKADPALRATFKVVKNPNVSISDNDIKSRVISTINKYFDIANWDFGETFYFSELSAYLHTELVPNISSIIIVPADSSVSFGGLYQINAEANEIVVSAATVDNVEIITAITAAQINQSLAGLNTL